MEKRTEFCKDDLLEELGEVFSEVRQIEENFKKVLDVCSKSIRDLYIKYIYIYTDIHFNIIAFLMDKNKELFKENNVTEKDNAEFISKILALENSNAGLIDENDKIKYQIDVAKIHGKSLEKTINSLNSEILVKNQLLEDQEQSGLDKSVDKSNFSNNAQSQ